MSRPAYSTSMLYCLPPMAPRITLYTSFNSSSSRILNFYLPLWAFLRCWFEPPFNLNVVYLSLLVLVLAADQRTSLLVIFSPLLVLFFLSFVFRFNTALDSLYRSQPSRTIITTLCTCSRRTLFAFSDSHPLLYYRSHSSSEYHAQICNH